MRLLTSLVLAFTILWGIRAVAAPDVEHWITDSGAPVYFIAARALPMVDVRLVFDAGSARDLDGAAGVALLTNALISSGSEHLDEDAVVDGFDAVGAQFGTNAFRDMAMVSLRSLSAPEYLDPALEILEELLAGPAFPENAFERQRRRMLLDLQSEAQSPAAVGQRALFEAVYGDHPYGRRPGGTEASLRTLTRAAVQEFYRRHYVTGNVIVSIVGDMDVGEARALADRLTGVLPSGASPPALPVPGPANPGAVIRVPFPSSQAHVYIGDVGVARSAPDYYALILGNHVLGGGGLVSRLSSEVRDQRGLSYSVYSQFSPMAEAGLFLVNLQTRTERVEEAVEVVFRTLTEFIASGPAPEELEAARRSMLGGFPLRFDSNGKLVEMLAAVGFYGLPLDYLNYYPAQLEQVTGAAVLEAFGLRLDIDRMVTVIVGGDA